MADLVAVCPTCGEVHDEIASLQATVSKLGRERDALKRELNTRRQANPHREAARRLYDLWVEKLGKNASTIFDEKREKALLTMLKAYEDQGIDGEGLLHMAILGLSKRPYVGPHGRVGTKGPGTKRFDDLKYAVQDASSVERFIGYAEEVEAEAHAHRKASIEQARESTTATLVEIYGRCGDGSPRNYDAFPQVIRALEDYGCEVRGEGARYRAQCPVHESRSLSLSLFEKDDGLILLHCFAGCETENVLRKIGLDFMHLMGVESGQAA